MADAPSFSLKGRVIVLLGGSGLLGRALVTAVGAAGATLVATSRDRSKIASAVEAECAAGHSVGAEEVDIESEDSLRALVGRIHAAHGRIDGMIYNAVSRPMRAWNDPISNWESSIATNATGYFAAMRVFGDDMALGKGGSIVAISSMQGMVGFNPWLYEGTQMGAAPDYFFHKAGMINMTKYMATHYGPLGVRVNVVAPGGIFNPEKPPPASFLERFAKMTALGRMADSGEIGGAVVFLLGDSASYVTGITIPVDGGYTAR